MEKKTVEQLQKILVNMVPAALEGVMACELFRLRHADTCPKIVHLLIRQAMGAISQRQDGVFQQLGSLYVDVQKDVKEAMDTEAIKTFNALLEAWPKKFDRKKALDVMENDAAVTIFESMK